MRRMKLFLTIHSVADQVRGHRLSPVHMAVDHRWPAPDVPPPDCQRGALGDDLAEFGGQIPAHAAEALEEVVDRVDCFLLVEVTGEGAGILVVYCAPVIGVPAHQHQCARSEADEILLGREVRACQSQCARGGALAYEDRGAGDRVGGCRSRHRRAGHLAEVVLQLGSGELSRAGGFGGQHDGRGGASLLNQRQRVRLRQPGAYKQEHYRCHV